MFEGWLFYTLTVVVTLSEALVFLVLFYYYYISVYGWRKHDEEKDFNPEKRFALITAAHNEEAVIRYHLDSLKQLNYPVELFDIYVIADNCTDNTAAVARHEGANVFERFSPQKGKGCALEWMFNEKLFTMEDEKYDAICLFDADNVVSSNFLLEMNSKLKKGFRSIQGYLDTKNPNDSWVTASYATAYWSMNRMWQLARFNKGLSNALGGTGVCLEYKLLKEYGWGATCLTEDLEFTMKLLLNGIKTSWAHEAKVYDEKPVLFSQTWRQRTRWLSGHWNVALRYMIPLVKKGIKEKKWYPIDGAIYLFQPFAITIMLFNFIMGAAYACFPQQPLFATPFSGLAPAWVWWSLAVLGYCYPMLGLILEKAPRKAYFYYITYPFYGLTWFPVTVWGLFQRNNQGEWAHTAHNRGISISAIESSDKVEENDIQPKPVPVQQQQKGKGASVRRTYAAYATLVTRDEKSSKREPISDVTGRAVYPTLVGSNKSASILKPVEVVKATISQEKRSQATAGGKNFG
ncbi:MAG: glycosyltransferase family 2 protein [Syntrophomonas sp.]|nr:glycosyltransferase family 2 protein [Syntrophomonas sp.]